MADQTSDDDDDLELELEPVDPEILAVERERVRQKTDVAVANIDVDELFGHDSAYSDLSVDWTSWRSFRFTTRHMLGLTALLAIVMTVFILTDAWRATALVVAAALAAGWIWAMRLERRQAAERARRREEFIQNRPKQVDILANATVDANPPPRRPPLKFAFTMKQLLILMAGAAVVVAMVNWIGLSELAAMSGMIALVGIVLHIAGFDPPPLFVLGWWLLLVFYLAVGLAAVLGIDFGAGA